MNEKKNIFLILAGSLIVIIALVNIFNLVNNDEFKPVSPNDSGALPIYFPDNNQDEISATGEFPQYIPDRLIIPAIYLDAPVEPIYAKIINVDGEDYIQYVAPDEFAAGWHVNSAKLGQIGNTVLSGHHNAFGKVFENLERLEIGNQIRLMSGEKIFEYIITNKMILPEKDEPLEVRLDNARWIMPSNDERITLVTCWPQKSNTHRLIIVAVPFKGLMTQEDYMDITTFTPIPTSSKPNLPSYQAPTSFYQPKINKPTPTNTILPTPNETLPPNPTDVPQPTPEPTIEPTEQPPEPTIEPTTEQPGEPIPP